MRTSEQAYVSHLSSHAAEHLRALLVEASAAEAARLADHDAAVRELRDLTDPDSVLERELAEVGAARARAAVADIEHALRRIETGSYGSCEACGVPIPFERLEAVPAARFCVPCLGRAQGRP